MTEVLNYSRMPRSARRRVRVAICLVALVGIAVACAKWRPLRTRIEQAHYVWLQGQAMNHSAPADQVAFETDPVRASALLSSRPELYSQPTSIPWESEQHKATYEKRWQPLAFYTPPVLPRIWPRRWVPDGVLFLHRRQNPAGQERLALVQIRMINVRSPGEEDLLLNGVVCQPASLEPGSRIGVTRSSLELSLDIQRMHEPLRFFVGQPDPDDPTHFIIGVEAGGKRSVIDGWLRAPNEHYSMEHIELKVRNEDLFTIYGL